LRQLQGAFEIERAGVFGGIFHVRSQTFIVSGMRTRFEDWDEAKDNVAMA
jgi:hypothetical protein